MSHKNLLFKISCLLILLLPTFLQAQADLELSMTSNNPQVGIYDYITITTTLQNTGTQSAEDVVINFDIPTGIAIAGEFAPNAEQGILEGFYGGSTEGNWLVGEVAAGQTLTFEITLFTLSENNMTFYGQVAQGGNNDPDSTPGNGTCCNSNEDDEVGYSFPNDNTECTYDQATAELICNDNGTSNDISDDTYTLSFRADGSNGMFHLFIPELNYNQTSAYSIGLTELTTLSLDIESLTLIFTDAAGAANCGETLTVVAPSCGDIPLDCEGDACSDLELTAANTATPSINSNTNASFSLLNNASGGNATGIEVTFNKNGLNVVGTPTVSHGTINLYWTDNPVWVIGDLPSNETATIDFELFTLAANYSLYGQVTTQNEDDFDSTPNNGNGTTPVEDDEAIYRSVGGTDLLADLILENLDITNSPIVGGDILSYSYNVTNQGEGGTDAFVSIRAWISTDNVLSADDIAGGQNFSNVSTIPGQSINQIGQSSILNTLADGNYFLILEADEFDIIQESNENNNITVAAFTIGSETSCNLTISDTQLTCADNTMNAAFVYAIEVSGASGNTVNYQVLGTNFSGTIVVGQLVDVLTLPQGTDFTIVVTEPNNTACNYTLTSNIPVAPSVCFEGSEGADVTLAVSEGFNTPTGIYQTGEAIFTLTNTGSSAATGLTVTFSKNQVNITGTPTTTAGTPQLHWTDNPVWQVGTLAPGQSEIIVFPVFTVGENFSLYAEVTAMTEDDNDSTPNNGNGVTPNEDDETLWSPGNADNGSPDFEDGVDLNLSINISQTTVPVFSTFSTTIAVSNEGNETMTGATVNVQAVDGFVFEGENEYNSTQGEFMPLNGDWILESLAPGEIAILIINYFTVQAGEKVIYAQVTSANEQDTDSSPANGTCCTTIEDDEAVATISVSNNLTNDTPVSLNAVNSIVAAYPNPTTDVLTVEINSENTEAVNLQILDVTGSAQIFQEMEGIKGVQTVKVPVSKLEKGIYLLSVRKGEELIVKRFVKM